MTAQGRAACETLREAEELTECRRWGKTNSPRRTSKQGWFELRWSYVLLLHEEGSDERSALGAESQGTATPCPVKSVPRVRSEVRAVAFAYGEGLCSSA
jgi:hypothetical protein